MNIIVLGGGTIGKFGNDFAVKARNEGHRVIIFSHKHNGTNDIDQHVINYNDVNDTRNTFTKVLEQLDSIDIVLINQNGMSYPNINEHSDHTQVYPDSYYQTINLHAVSTHLLLAAAYPKMHDGSKVSYMSTGLAYRMLAGDQHPYSGYAAIKAFMTHIILGFANNRQKKITYTTVSPHFTYDDIPRYQRIFDNLYTWIFKHDDMYNGKMISAWDPNTAPSVIRVKYD